MEAPTIVTIGSDQTQDHSAISVDAEIKIREPTQVRTPVFEVQWIKALLPQ
jgi:hypothetical protein